MNARAKPHLILRKHRGRWTASYFSPHTILPSLKTRADLLATLAWHACPFINMRVPMTWFARRHHVERVRPALRWFCKVYKVAIPPWLASDERFTALPRGRHWRLFGPSPISIREFGSTCTTRLLLLGRPRTR